MRARLALTVVAVLAAAGCTAPPSQVSISVDQPTAMVDGVVDVRIAGLPADGEVTLRAQTTDYQGTVWRSDTRYRADGGRVDVATRAPLSGGYRGVDPMGPLWSMAPVGKDPDSSFFFPGAPDGFRVTLSALVAGRTLASTVVTRRIQAPDATRAKLLAGSDGFYGMYVAPPPGTARHTAVLTFGGSEGGALTGELQAEVLAAHGYPALGIAYFGAPGLPDSLSDIPLEYFATALRWLRAQPGVDPGHVLVWGVSRGGEAALLVAAHFPDLVNGVIAAAPSSLVNSATPDANGHFDLHKPAWTLSGQPLPPVGRPFFDVTTPADPASIIPVERIRGPVLLVAGGDDRLWPSAWYAQQVITRLDTFHDPYPHENLTYPDAGHGVGGLVPYFPASGPIDHSRYGVLNLGGSRTADARAMADAWPKVLAFLATA